MEVTIKGEAQEVAALVVAIQERREDSTDIDINPHFVAQAICDRGQEAQPSK